LEFAIWRSWLALVAIKGLAFGENPSCWLALSSMALLSCMEEFALENVQGRLGSYSISMAALVLEIPQLGISFWSEFRFVAAAWSRSKTPK